VKLEIKIKSKSSVTQKQYSDHCFVYKACFKENLYMTEF